MQMDNRGIVPCVGMRIHSYCSGRKCYLSRVVGRTVFSCTAPNAGGKDARELGVKWGLMICEKHCLALDATFFAHNLPMTYEITNSAV